MQWPKLFRALAVVCCLLLSVGVAVAQTAEALVVEGNDVGVGTNTPVDRLHLVLQGKNGGVRIESTNPGDLPQFTLIEPSRTWRVRVNSGGTFVFTDATAGNAPFQVYAKAVNGLFRVGATSTGAPDINRVSINGELFIGTTQVAPDYVFEPSYELESIDEHAEYMWDKKHLPAVGAALVDGDQSQINVGAQQFGMLEELEKAHIYIEQLHNQIEELEARLAAIETSRDD